MNYLSPRRESYFYHKGLPCVVLFTSFGHRCGYVGVPNSHPLSNIKYNETIQRPELLERIKNSPTDKKCIISLLCWDGESVRPDLLLNAHGGITYSGKDKTYPTCNYDPIWWFGFDCAHYGDEKDFESLKEYYPLKHYNMVKKYAFFDGSIRTKTYVEDECKSLAEQLVELEEILKYTRG